MLTDDLDILRTSWLRSLRAANKAPNTLKTYGRAAEAFIAFMADPPDDSPDGEESPRALLERMPVHNESDIRRDHIEAFIGDLHRHHKAGTVRNRWSALHVWFEWMVGQADIEVDVHPMNGMRRPIVPEEHPEILTVADIRKLVATCDRKRFAGIRDEAIIRTLADTGIRIDELRGLMIVEVLDGVRVPTVDMDLEAVYVMGKGRRPRTVAFGPKTADALDRYLRARRKHPWKDMPNFWLPDPRRRVLEPLGDSGIRRMLDRRAKAAGIRSIHPHLFRHTWADAQKRAGLDRGDLKNQGGWRSDAMVERYGAIAETDRALQAHRRRSFGDQI